MENIDYEVLIAEMLHAAQAPLAKHWKVAKPYAEKEIQSFTGNVKLIAKLKEEGKITEEQAKLYLDIQRSSMRIVLLTIEGLGMLAVEAAINAALNVAKSTVNTVTGWSLL